MSGRAAGDPLPLDEETAWRLVRAVTPGAVPAEGVSRVRDRREDGAPRPPGAGEEWLEVRSSGEWRSSSPPTDSARDVLDLYLPLRLPSDLVVAQLAQSLDGRIATESGHSHYVSGREDIRRLHRVRALVDAVVVGAGTVASDNPRLTVREARGEDPVRVVLDPDDRLDPHSYVFSDGAARTLVIHRKSPRRRWRSDHVEPLVLPHTAGRGFDPGAVVDALRERGLKRVLVEGGGVTVSRFLEAGVLDRLHVTVAPLLIGSGRPALSLEPVETLAQALRPPCRHFRLGQDLLFDLDLSGLP